MLALRPATLADLPILNALYADMDGKALLSSEQMTEIWGAIAHTPGYTIYVASLDDPADPTGNPTGNPEIIGTFALLILPTFMHRGFHKSALLDAVAVRSSHRSQGLGSAMIRAALDLSQAAGCYKVMLSSNLARDRAHAFYESLGFQQHGWSFSLVLPTAPTASPSSPETLES